MDEEELEALLHYRTELSADERRKFPWAMPESIRSFQADERPVDVNKYLGTGPSTQLIIDVISKFDYVISFFKSYD